MTETSSADSVASDKPAVQRKAWRWLLVAGAALVVLMALAITSLWVWAGRAGSLPVALEWVSRHALPAGSTLDVQGASGSLRYGGHIQQLIYSSAPNSHQPDQGRLVLRLDGVQLQWNVSVWDRFWDVQQLSIETLQVADSRPPGKEEKRPAQPLQELILPLDIRLPVQINHVYIHPASATEAVARGDATGVAAASSAAAAVLQQVQAVASAAGGIPQVLERALPVQSGEGYADSGNTLQAHKKDTAPVHIQDIRLLYQWQRHTAAHQLTLDSLVVAHSRWQAQADVQGRTPMHSQLQLKGVLDTAALQSAVGRMPAAPELAVHVQAAGTLAGADAQLQVQAHVQPHQQAADAASEGLDAQRATQSQSAAQTVDSTAMHIHAQAVLNPWLPMPIQRAQASWQHVNAAVLWPQAPQTALQGKLALEPEGRGDDGVAVTPSQTAPGLLGFLGQGGWKLTLDGHNQQPGAVDVGRVPLQQLQLQAHYRAGTLEVPALMVQFAHVAGKSTHANRIQAQGRYVPAQGLQGQAQVQELLASSIHSKFDATPIQGRLSARMDWADTASAPQTGTAPLIFELDLKGLPGNRARRAHPLALDVFSAQGRWHQQQLAVETLLLRMHQASLQGDAAYAADTQSAQANLTVTLPAVQGSVRGYLAPDKGLGQVQLNVADWAQLQHWLQQWPGADALRQWKASGRTTVQASWKGGWQHQGRDLQIQAQLAVPHVGLRSTGQNAQQLGAVTVRDTQFALDGTLVRSALRGQMTAEHIVPTAQGREDTRSLHAALHGHISRSEDTQAVRIHMTRLQAAVRGQQNLHATLAAPLQLDVQHNSQSTRMYSSGFALYLHSGDVRTGNARLQTEGIYWQQQGSSTTLRSKGSLHDISLAWINALANQSLQRSGVSGDLMLAGNWDVELGSSMRLDVQLRRSHGDLHLAPGLEEAASGTGQLRAGIRLAQLHMTGSRGQVRSHLQWNSAQAGTADVQIDTRLSRNAAGGWTWSPSAPLAGHIRASLPRAGLWNLFAPPGWRMRGTVQADIALAGDFKAPQATGTVLADELGVRSVVDGIAFDQGKMRLRLAGQRVHIDEISLHGPAVGGDKGGRIHGSGQISWGGGDSAQPLRSLQLHLNTRIERLRLSSMPERNVLVSGNLQSSLRNQILSVRGALRIDKALIELPEGGAPTLDSDVRIRASSKHPRAALAQPQRGDASDTPSATALSADIQVRTAAANKGGTAASQRKRGTSPAAATAGTPIAASTAQIQPDVHITVDMGDNLRVRGSGLDTRLDGTLTITHAGSLRELPRVTGTIRTDRGTFRAYGQELDIEAGSIRFTGNPTSPQLDITAIRPHLGDMRVGVRVRGSVSHPQVKLFSSPDMPEADKLSWLVLGRASGTAADAALLQQAALALLAGNGRGITGQMADALGLDALSFKSGDNGDLASSSVTVGKRLSKNLYIAYEQGLGAALGTVYFFYDLTRSLKLRGQAGTPTSAVDLIYSVSYD